MERYKEIFVEVNSKEINNNNLTNNSPYQLIRMATNERIEINQKEENKQPKCDLCLQNFQNYSKLYKHKAKVCYEDAIQMPPFPNPIKIQFPEEMMEYVGDMFEELKMEVKNEEEENGKLKYIIVDESNLMITLRRLYLVQVTKYNIEKWYDEIDRLAIKNNEKEYTAKTKIIPLDDDQLKTLSKWSSINLSDALGMTVRPTNEELKKREEMEEKMSEFLASENSKEYFCKFSTRSPKDSVSLRDIDQSLPLNEKMKLKYDKLKVKEGIKAFDLLTKSQRIFSDIQMYFQFRVPNTSSGALAIIFREWNDHLRQDHEFRCYIYRGKLTAISQYNCYCYFENLQDEDHIMKIRSSIQLFINKIGEAIRISSYVIDIGVMDDYSCQVIELNPFGAYMSSGSALYSWSDDFDLLHGNLVDFDYPAIRILKHLIDDDEKKDVAC